MTSCTVYYHFKCIFSHPKHYKRTLKETFDVYPNAQYMIILEEDLDVSVDIFSYFNQLLPLMDTDESLYCISAWNDQVCYKEVAKAFFYFLVFILHCWLVFGTQRKFFFSICTLKNIFA